MENLQTGLILLMVGMVTVFTILLLLIILGKYLIIFVNKYFPEDETVSNKKTTQSPTLSSIIEETIKTITNGKGKVKSIEKI